jgi:tetratricopeptide (TPR) repeat protein
LETIEDDNLKNFLIDIKFPIESKVLITSRKRLGQVEHVVYLDKFNYEETRKYVLSQLKHRSYSACKEELIQDIHRKTGGIPLAIKVIIPWIIEGKIKDKLERDIDEDTDILKFCFDRVYTEFLSSDAKKLFCILSLAPTEISEAALRFISGLKDKSFNESLSSLINYSLVFISKKDGASEEYFSMLPLTQNFGQKMASKDFPNLKESINKGYLRFLEISKSEQYSAKRAIAVNKAEEARRLSSLGRIDEASILFKESIEYDPKCDYALYLYSVFCREKQDFGQAKTLIEKAIRINETNPFYWNEYATILELWGDFKKAEKMLESALKKTNNNRSLVMKLVLIKSKLQKNKDVISLAKNNILYDIKDKKDRFINTLLTIALMEGHWRIAYNLSKSGKYNEASKELNQGLKELNELSEKNLVFKDNGKLLWEEKKTLNKLGDLAIKLDDKESAKKYYERAIYEIALFEDRKRHNEMIKDKLEKLNSI